MRFSREHILLFDKFKVCRFGSETKFSILAISLFCKLNYYNFSSPSNKGTCDKL